MSLNQSEQSKRIFENSPALLQAYPESAILIDRKGRILSVNPVAAERLGKPVGDLVGTCLWECFPDEVVVRRRALAQGVFETGAALCHSDKRNGRQYLTEFHPICNPKGAVEQLAVFAWDVTEARESLVSMQEREREFRALAENSPDVIIRVDPQWRCLYANPAIERFTGLPPEEFLSIRAPFFGEQESIWTRSLEQVFSTGRKCRFQSEYMRKDGQLFHLDWILTPEFGFDGSIEGVLSIIRDITEQVQAKRELERSESKFRLLFENISDPVFIRALEGGRLGPLLQVNKAACEVYGYTHEEWSSLSIGDLIVPERKHKVPSVVQDMIRRKDAIIETMHITKHGRRIPVEAHLRVTVMEG
ncbi:MAG: PAS domain S-box protein [Desulfovibrionales bacterium]